ncbi:hypothetical protein CHS0354_025022 [Potamilus streckersoni]|uniref:VWFA domain-containing protein n=1 Tax=Potamilus streckersoni TaxID=2493646 RepID=A0AAE0TA44_9BIVA|nr:hypothetical protein CHS0354_025022 [Potamilus streckersoni]
MTDQEPHLVIKTDEEIYQKFQELKEKVLNLRESNRIIESRQDVLCRGVGDRERTQCLECRRQKENEAEVLKELQEKANKLEEQERHQENEMKKLGESIETVMKNFDKILEIAQAKKITSQSGNKSKWDHQDFATVHFETERDGRCENERGSSQDTTQADCAQPADMNIDNEVNHNDDHKPGRCSDNQTEETHAKKKVRANSNHRQMKISSVNNLCGKTDGKNNTDIKDKNLPNTNMGYEPDHPVHRRTTLQGEGHQVAKDQETKIQYTEKRNELVDQSTNLQNVGNLTEGLDHSQNSVSSRGRETDSLIASMSEIYKIQTPGPQQTVTLLDKVTSSDENRELKEEITRDTIQKADKIVKNAKTGDTMESICSENGSIKNPNFQRKTQSYVSKESPHQQFDEVRQDGHTDTSPASTVDLDQHAPIFRVPDAGYWAAMAQEELDIAREIKVGELHTVLCVDTSASMRQGSAWVQTIQFFNQFIGGLEEVSKEFDITQEYVAISVFGKEVKVIKRLTNDLSMLRQAFGTLKIGGPSAMFGGLLMALAGVGENTRTATAAGIKVLHRIILISDGKPTDPLLASGPDVCSAEEKHLNQMTVLQVVENISSRKIRIHCVPVGDADVTFMETISSISNGKVFSIKDGRKLARKTINTLNAGFLVNHWKVMNVLHKKLLRGIHYTEFTLEDAMLAITCNKDMQFLHPVSRIVSLSTEDRAEVLEIAQEAIDDDLLIEGEDAMEKYHYEFDDPNVKLPPLGTRVRRGPDWDKDFQDEDGPGTILGHHKEQKQVYVEWDRNGDTNFYRYGDMGKYDVVIVDEPRLMYYNDLILTGCHVKRGKDWIYGNHGGSPDAVGVVLKVLEDGKVVVRWPDKSKDIYRFGSEGFFDLEICNPFDCQVSGGAEHVSQSTPSQESQSLNQSASEPSKNKNALKKNKNS